MNLTRPTPILFGRPDGSIVKAPPVTRGQMREVFVIDKDDADPAEKRGAHVAVFLRHAKWFKSEDELLKGEDGEEAGTIADLLPTLTAAEETDIIHAFIAQHHGYEPATAVAIQEALREIVKKKSATPPPR